MLCSKLTDYKKVTVSEERFQTEIRTQVTNDFGDNEILGKENELIKLRLYIERLLLEKKIISNRYEEEILELKTSLHKKDLQIADLQRQLEKFRKTVSPNVDLFLPLPESSQPTPTNKRFVQVIFSKYSHDRYDYLLGDNSDVKVGDFVMVRANGRVDAAKVLKISEPDETSKYAKTPIIEKAQYPKWK